MPPHHWGAGTPGATCRHLFATTSMGIFLATIARSMPQSGLLLLVLLPLLLCSCSQAV